MVEVDYQKKYPSFSERLNDTTFIDRLFSLFLEDGVTCLNYGEFISKVYTVGMVKVLKSLELYKVEGRGHNRKVLVHKRLKLVIDTSILDSEEIGKNVVKLCKGGYNDSGLFFLNATPEYISIKQSKASKEIGCFGTYIMFNPTSGIYKIGRSKNVFYRVQKLRFEFGSQIDIIGVCVKDCESELHFKYRLKRQFGEWFALSTDDVLDIFNSHKFVSIHE